MKQTIDIIIPWGAMKGQVTQFTGDLFEHNGISFVIGKIGFCNAKKQMWRMYEVSSGKAFTGSFDTKKECMACMEERFAQFGVEKIKSLINEAILANGEKN